MYWRNLTTALLLNICFFSAAQEPATADRDFTRLQNQLQSTSPDSAAYLIDSSLQALSDKATINRIKVLQANLYANMGDFQNADSLFTLLLPEFRASQDYLLLLKIYAGKGQILQTTGQLIEGIQLMTEAQEFIDNQNTALASNDHLNEIGSIYRTTGILYAMQMGLDEAGQFNQQSAEKYFRKSYGIFTQTENHGMAGTTLFNIGNVQVSEDSTMAYWQKALAIFDEHGMDRRKSNIYQNLAILHIDKGEFSQALPYLRQVEGLLPPNPNPFDIALLKVKFGRAHLGLKQLKTSIRYLNEALDIALEYQMISIEGEAYELLIEAYSADRQFENALETYVKYDTLVRRFEKSETERIFRETEAQYKTREQQDQITLLLQQEALNTARIRQQRMALGIGIVLVLVIGLISYFLWKRSQERKKLNEQLRELDETRTRFLVNVAHELRTPVTLIHAPLDDALEQLENNNVTRVKSDLLKISNNTRKLLQLTNEVLDISKLDDGALQLESTPTALRAFISRSFYAFESLAVRNHIKWESRLDIDETAYLVDQKKLELIINNLLSNAIKHTAEGGQVTLSAQTANGYLNLEITDTGKGINATALPKIFDRYFQANENDKAQGGLGVGLSLVKELVDFMQGQVKVQSEPGVGTTFSIQLPLTKSDQDIEAEPLTDQASSLENRPQLDLSSKAVPHILVVEDNPEMADFIQQLLSDHYRVTLAHNGEQGLERLHSGKFDLITADVMMPHMNGISFVKQLKEHNDWKNTSVIMITALSEEADRMEGLRLGIDDYITKPFSANELKVRVDNLIQNSMARQELVSEPEEEMVGNEKLLLDKAREKVVSHMSDNALSVKDLADHLNLSERQANRVLKKITGLSCLPFIREIRLQHAYRLLESRKYATIAEVANAVGFENTSYFTRLFAGRFGKKPSELL